MATNEHIQVDVIVPTKPVCPEVLAITDLVGGMVSLACDQPMTTHGGRRHTARLRKPGLLVNVYWDTSV